MRQTIPKSLNCWKKVLLLSLTEIKFHKHYHVISEECMGSRSRQGVLPWSKNDKHLGTVKKGVVLYTEKAMCSNFAEELPGAATWTRWAIREKGQCFDMFESCLEHIWTPKMMPKHHQSWSDMKGNPKAVPVCILSVELRKLEVCDFGRFRFRYHLNPPEVLWCWRGPLGTIPCMDSISVGWNSTDVDNVQE